MVYREISMVRFLTKNEQNKSKISENQDFTLIVPGFNEKGEIIMFDPNFHSLTEINQDSPDVIKFSNVSKSLNMKKDILFAINVTLKL